MSTTFAPVVKFLREQETPDGNPAIPGIVFARLANQVDQTFLRNGGINTTHTLVNYGLVRRLRNFFAEGVATRFVIQN